MVKPKPRSKRVPVRLRHKIEKASAAKGRKARKLAKANPQWRSRLKKDPGIPNLFPYKDRILAEIEEKKRRKDEEALRKREDAKAARLATATNAKADDDDDEDLSDAPSVLASDEEMDHDALESSNPMAALLASARARAAEYDGLSDPDGDGSDSSSSSSNPQQSTRISRPLDPSLHAFPAPLQALLQTSDILLYVLDARDPLTTRSPHLERQLRLLPTTCAKPLLLILNKIDLVPPATLAAWLQYLRRSWPTLPLRASSSAPNARTFAHGALTAQATGEKLLRVLKAYAQRQDVKRSVTVGVLGFPNVGKSSVINALCARLKGAKGKRGAKREVPCPVGAEAGVTTALRTVKVDGKLRVLDSPGVVFPAGPGEMGGKTSGKGLDEEDDGERRARLTLLSALPPKHITDPIPAVALLLARVRSSPEPMAALQAYYHLPALLPSPSSSSSPTPSTEQGSITHDFLLQVARQRGRLGKGGVPNLRSAAMAVLGDWRDGRIGAWVEAPPAMEEGEGREGKGRADAKAIVDGWGEEFRIEGLWGGEGEGEGQGQGQGEGGVLLGGDMEVEMAVR